MRIIPYTGNIIRIEGNNEIAHRRVRSLNCDTVSFSGMMTGKEFKKRCARYMTCLYTGTPFVEELNKLTRQGAFKGSIAKVIKRMEKYEEALDNSEAELFRILKKYAELKPHKTLPQAIEELVNSASEEIQNKQTRCMHKIKVLGAGLPENKLNDFYLYMQNVDRKIYDEPIKKEFSMKEFKYMITKLSEYITDAQFKEIIQKYIRLMPESHNDFRQRPKNKYYMAGKSKVETAEQTADLIDKLRDIARKRGFKKIERLCESNIKMLYGESVHIPFSNKGFVYDLRNILDGVEDKKLVEEILNEAKILPKSSDDINAFILKFKDMDEDMIGSKLFGESVASIEHLHPQSLGGSNYMVNNALAKKWINTKRQNRPLDEILQQFPIENQQLYLENLAKCVEKGLVPREEALMHIDTIEEEGKIILDKSSLLRF